MEQGLSDIGGDKCKIFGQTNYCFKVTMHAARAHPHASVPDQEVDDDAVDDDIGMNKGNIPVTVSMDHGRMACVS